MENMNNVAKREMRRIDGKPDCFGKEGVCAEIKHCAICTAIGECVDALMGISKDQRAGINADVRRGTLTYANNC